MPTCSWRAVGAGESDRGDAAHVRVHPARAGARRRAAHRAARGRRRPHPAGGRPPCCSAGSPSSRSSATRRDIRPRAAELGVDIARGEGDLPDRSRPASSSSRPSTHGCAHTRASRSRMAADTVTDVSYFGTMMVHLGLADGMVSGAPHTTAHTITPSFEIIKTMPGVSVVSSVFLMALADRVLVYGDCAVVPDPTAEQLADIAISSADDRRGSSASSRGSRCSRYSTGESGSGADVDKVRAATALVRERGPELPVEGPIQYDAAIDASGRRDQDARTPTVAGRATVFIFPDLNTGNNTYKAVQRSSGAVAIGPVLQGLRRSRSTTFARRAGARHRQHDRDHRDPGAVDTARARRRPAAVRVFVVNSGSSSVKYAVRRRRTAAQTLEDGIVERIGEPGSGGPRSRGGIPHRARRARRRPRLRRRRPPGRARRRAVHRGDA